MPSRVPPPRCPKCNSLITERLPFTAKGSAPAVYSCMECGYEWRVPAADTVTVPFVLAAW